MLYPSISQYIDAIGEAVQFCRSLVGVSLMTTVAGDPIYCSGNFGVVFKVRFEHKTFALKCFTRHQTGRDEAYSRLCAELPTSDYLIAPRWLPGELLVAPHGSDILMPFDAVRMEYVEGRTMDNVIIDCARSRDRLGLWRLSEAFDRMAIWLLGQSFAHGDLKPTNIMVSDDWQLQLIDYDGFFLPSMAGEAQREVGTEVFQHPSRGAMEFSGSIDDYSIALLSLSLRAIAREPELLGKSNSGRGELLVHPADAVGGCSSMLDYIELSGLVSAELIAAVRSQSPVIEGLDAMISRSRPPIGLSELCPVQRSSGWGFVVADGEVAISPIYDAAREFEGDLAAVCLNGRWGFVDRSGAVVVPLRYDRVWAFSGEGLALVKVDGLYGFVNAKGREVIKPLLHYAASFCEGLAVAVESGKYGYIDVRGRWVVAARYDYARSFRDGVAEVELDGVVTQISRPQ